MKIRTVTYWIGAVAIVCGTFYLGFTRKPTAKPPLEKVVPVEVEPVHTASIKETVELTGWIQANQVVDVASKVAGRIESLEVVSDTGVRLAVEEGLVVGRGRQIAVIDHDVYLAQVAAAKAGVKAAEVALTDAEREKKRISALFESGSTTEQSRDKAVTAAELAAANLSLAKANLELAEINLRESTIIAPIDGVVTAKHIDQGNLVRIGDRLVTLADIRTVKIIVSAAERYGAQITVGTPVRIKVDAYPERIFDANVYSVYPALDVQTHTIQIEMRVKNEQLLLKPGMFARVTLITMHKDNVVVIARDVILGGKVDEPYVYVVEETSAQKVARKRIVTTGITEADRREIVDGLKLGEVLVVNGMHYLADGTSVEIVRIEDIK